MNNQNFFKKKKKKTFEVDIRASPKATFGTNKKPPLKVSVARFMQSTLQIVSNSLEPDLFHGKCF